MDVSRDFSAFYAANKDRCVRAVLASGVDPGPVQDVSVHGHAGSLMKGQRTWYRRAPLDITSTLTLQATSALTEDQVLEIANGVNRAD